VPQRYSARDCAHDVLAALDQFGGATEEFEAAVNPAVQELLRRPDLLTLGVTRQAFHADASLWLYYDYDLHIHISPYVRPTTLPAHNHGTWELVGVYRGSASHTLYNRTDDGTVWGKADLEVADRTVLGETDIAMAVPPRTDIHELQTLEPETFVLAVTGGHFSPIRTYFDPERGRYTERPILAYRQARGMN
jgi:predicted metal-dependent enzyme (double-stranded beta helix superfamily)